jgi:PAS domain S-box-containing protein
MTGFLAHIFDATGLMPRGAALLWRPELIWLDAVAGLLAGLAFLSMAASLLYLSWRRRDFEYGWMFRLFGILVLADGATHLLGVWILWRPDYAIEGVVKAALALVALPTAFILWPVVARVAALPAPATLRRLNEALQAEVRERDRVATTLQESEERYRALYNHTPMPLHSIDEDSRLISVSDHWCAMLGYTREEVLGHSIEDFQTPASLETRRRVWPQILVTGVMSDTEFQFVRKDGTVLDTLVRASIERDAAGRFVRSLSVVIDITERKRAEAALRRETQERKRVEEVLRQAQKMEAVGQLTGGIAHDFNNLLTVIMGNVETLQRKLPEKALELRPFAEAAMRGATRAALLVSQLLAFSRRQPLNPRSVDLNKLVGGLSELLHRTLGETIAVETVLGARLWHTKADPNQLENALLNLAINARDAMPGGGRLTIETANVFLDEAYAEAAEEPIEAGQYVMLAVTDNGSGMSPEVIARAFEPFFTTKGVGRGSGLGLSMVYGFVKQSGGHVRIYSEGGQGTTVKIYLPRLTVSDGPGERRREGAVMGGSGETVLVVEDDDEVRSFAVDSLRDLGYRVVEAADAEAALARLAGSPEVVLLFTDVGLPGVNGRRLADEALRRRPDLKVLYTTGYARNAIVHNGTLDPGVELLAKPFTYAELARKIRLVLKPG